MRLDMIDLFSTPTSLGDANVIIEHLRTELVRRPQAVMIKLERKVEPFTIDQFPYRISPEQTYRLDLSDHRYIWTFQSIISTASPVVQVECTAYETAGGEMGIIPITKDKTDASP